LNTQIKEIQFIKQTVKKLSRKSIARRDFKNFFRSIDYIRTAELPAVLNLSQILRLQNEDLKILDISSPQILSAALAEASNGWNITYINPFQPELEEMLKIKSLLLLGNLSTNNVDITNRDDLNKLNDKFDYIFSSSVFEHIYPEEGGDIIAVKNINQLLKPNGMFIFSVPFYKQGFNEYKYGDAYLVKGVKNKKIFFQRFYDEDKLNRQLISPSNLTLESVLYLGERFYYPNNIHKRFAQNMQSKISSVLLGKFFFLISKLLISYSSDYKDLKKPYIAVVALRKK
jgi:2-polyprenyl-3-methyl-5-hydroxy-6-metoxy-1,4-benzoquinol methylase